MTLKGSFTSTEVETITTAGGESRNVYVVKTLPIAAKDMADVYYAKPIDGAGNEGALKRYSVAEYLYERLYANGVVNAEEGTKAYNQKLFYEAILDMGAMAQTVLINDKLAEGDALTIVGFADSVAGADKLILKDLTNGAEIPLCLNATERQRAILGAGGLLNYTRANG